jgi:iron complex transport system substrate-binding protein
LVIVTEEAGPVHVLEQLKATGVPVRVLPSGHTPEAAAERIREVGEAVGKSEAAEHLAFELEKQVHGLAKASGDAPRVLFLYARGGGVLNVSGSGTAADAMIALAGGRNAVEGFEGYKPLTAEAAVQAAPDVILMTTHGLEAAGGWEAILAQPGLSLTPAAKNRRVIGMDDLLLLGFGPRLPLAIEELSGKLHGVRVVGGP